MEHFSAADDTDDADLLAAQLKNLRHPCHLRLKNVIIRMEPTVSEAKPPHAGSIQNQLKMSKRAFVKFWLSIAHYKMCLTLGTVDSIKVKSNE